MTATFDSSLDASFENDIVTSIPVVRSRRGAAGSSKGRRIVIAADGSPASVAALRWAKTSLIDADDRVCVVTAYRHPPCLFEAPISQTDLQEVCDGAHDLAVSAIREVFGQSEPGADVEHVFAVGSIEELVERLGGDAAFIVLGTRSRRHLRQRLQGSTTNRITGRVSCPVISVPHPA